MIKDYKQKQMLLESIRGRLAPEAYERLHHLITIDDNWDGQGAEQIRLESFTDFTNFISLMDIPLKRKFGLFFSYEGEMILEGFEDDEYVIYFQKNEIEFITTKSAFSMNPKDTEKLQEIAIKFNKGELKDE